MSSLIVEVCKIGSIQPHDNADKLEIAIIKGWQCVVTKDKYKKGDKVIYIPIDSMIPFELSEKLGITKYLQNKKTDKFGTVISSSNRVRTIKLRGTLSQGLIIDIQDPSWKVGKDVREKLGIEKYIPKCNMGNGKNKNKKNLIWQLPAYPEFTKYTDIENYKNFLSVIEEGEEVVATEKIHGTNARMARIIIDPSYFSVFDRIKIRLKKIGSSLSFGLYNYDPSMFLVGSHNCNIKKLNDGEQNNRIPFSRTSMEVYWEMALKYGLDQKLKEGEEIFGEIYGSGIQKYLEYDGSVEIKIRFFDLKIRDEHGNMVYIDWDSFIERCKDLDLPTVPILYRGPFSHEILPNLVTGQSTLGIHIREGCVIKPVKERFHPKLGRVILKYLNDDYLLLKGKKEDELHKQNEEAELDIFDH